MIELLCFHKAISECDRYDYGSHMAFSYLYFDGSAKVIPPRLFIAEVHAVVKATACGICADTITSFYFFHFESHDQSIVVIGRGGWISQRLGNNLQLFFHFSVGIKGLKNAFLDIPWYITRDFMKAGKVCMVDLGHHTHRGSERPRREQRKRGWRLWKTVDGKRERKWQHRRQRGCTTGLGPTNSFCGATNQSALCESESATCDCSQAAASTRSVGARSKWIAVNSPPERAWKAFCFNLLQVLV